ncbi:MAG: ATP-binding cassette domain-containing protein [Clostridia bacterium]|nr:ATP-binding cassette domain-containing protein [Clostridia bacterium]
MEKINVSSLSFTYPSGSVPALKDISFSLESGDFLLVTGPNGSGKSTLLRMLKPQISPAGELKGSITFGETDIRSMSMEEQVSRIGFISQDPINQIVTDTVEEEMAFGLESLRMSHDSISVRIAETSAFLGIEELLHKRCLELSGGELQLVNLASVMVMRPELLILDEPVTQLDPLSSERFMAALERINRELGTTVIMAEHNLSGLLRAADRLLVLDDGSLKGYGEVREVVTSLYRDDASLFAALPAYVRCCLRLSKGGICPKDVREAARYLSGIELRTAVVDNKPAADTPVSVRGSHLYMRYTKDSEDILKDLSFEFPAGRTIAVFGINGSGKSTLLRTISGLLKPYYGRLDVHVDSSSLLPQDNSTLFSKETVRDELNASGSSDRTLTEAAELFDLNDVLSRHPFDISSGERQRVALAKIWLRNSDLILMDEPTRSLDNTFRKKLTGLIRERKTGKTVIIASHDMEFMADNADICYFLHDGKLIGPYDPDAFFGENRYFTTGLSIASSRAGCRLIREDDLVIPDETL